MYQIRVTNADGSNPIILDKADDKELDLVINSAGETVSFTIPKSDPKSKYVNPDDPNTPQRLWEWWDLDKGTRIQHGPITEVDDDFGKYTVKGGGISQFLVDHVKTEKTFYNSLGQIVDALRYENIAAQPATSTIAGSTTLAYSGIFGSITINDSFYSLSRLTSDYAIDDDEGVSYATGEVEPSNTFYAAPEYWSGMSDNDTLIIDFGSVQPIDKLELYFPWWGGPNNVTNRSYSFEIAYANDTDTPLTYYQSRPFGPWTVLATNGGVPYITEPGKPISIYVGVDSQETFDTNALFCELPASIEARYIRLHITDVQAWYQNNYKGTFDPTASYNIGDVVYGWGAQNDSGSWDGYYGWWASTVNQNYIGGGDPWGPLPEELALQCVYGYWTNVGIDTATYSGVAPVPAPMQAQVGFTDAYEGECILTSGYMPLTISDSALAPSNDCHASIIEARVLQEICPANTILPLALQRIDNDSNQIYYHKTFTSNDTTTTSAGFRQFEPGGFFSKFNVTWSGATNQYTTFFPTDCANCYPDGFNFGVVDQDNNMVFQSDAVNGNCNFGGNWHDWTNGNSPITPGHQDNYVYGDTISTPADMKTLGTEYILMKGSLGAYVSSCDAWFSTTDPYSWGSSYSWTETPNSNASFTFRGQSFKWYATVPKGKGGGKAQIYLSEQCADPLPSENIPTDEMIAYGGIWKVDRALIYEIDNIPEGLTADPLFEITYESGTLKPNTTYRIDIVTVSGFVSIDSFEGFWQASMVNYNEDSRRIAFNSMTNVHQVYDARYTGGSCYKWNDDNTQATFDFVGDRFMVIGAKGPDFGKMAIQVLRNNGQYESNPEAMNFTEVGGFVSYGAAPTNSTITVDLDNGGKRGGEISKACVFDSDDYCVDYSYLTTGHGGLPWGSYRVIISIDNSNGTYDGTNDDPSTASYADRCSNC